MENDQTPIPSAPSDTPATPAPGAAPNTAPQLDAAAAGPADTRTDTADASFFEQNAGPAPQDAADPRPEAAAAAPDNASRDARFGFWAELCVSLFGGDGQRWWHSRTGRRARSLAAPAIALTCLVAAFAAFPPSRDAMLGLFDGFGEAVSTRPELRINTIAIRGAERISEDAVVEALALTGADRGALTVDVFAARERLMALPWVENVSVSLRPPQMLDIEIQEKRPTALWRIDGRLLVLDAHGQTLDTPDSRRDWPYLALIVGPGADAAMDEGLAIDRAARLAGLPVVGLSRIGKRRWDLDLVGGLRIKLPADAPLEALEQAITWVRDHDLMNRAIEHVDLRLPFAPTIRRARRAIELVSGAQTTAQALGAQRSSAL